MASNTKDIYAFGVFESVDLDETSLKSILDGASQRVKEFSTVSILDIIEVLDRLSDAWKRGTPLWQKAFELTRAEVAFSDEMIAASLDVIPELLSAGNVIKRLKADFGHIERLDQFYESHSFQGFDRAFPLGVLFHVSAGNVFLGAIDSLLMGFLTKNISVIKLSSRNLTFPMLFAESLHQVDTKGVLRDKFAMIHFAGGSKNLEQLVKTRVNVMIAWGGTEMIESYKKDLPMGIKFIEYGPKISFQVVSKAGLESSSLEHVSAGIAQDIALWDQAACASPQNLFVEAGLDRQKLLAAVAQSLATFSLPRGRLSDDEYVEILKEKARAEYSELVDGGLVFSGEEFLIHFEKTPGLRTSPLNRTLIVKEFSSVQDLSHQLSGLKSYLQTCSYLLGHLEEDLYLSTLGALGVMRFAHLGQAMKAPIGAPHDGKLTLVELTRIVPKEQDQTAEGLVFDAIRNVPFYRSLTKSIKVQSLADMPLIQGSELAAANGEALKQYVHQHADAKGGYLFSSGGTSGAPKFSVYSHVEFSRVADLLAKGFAAQGIKEGSVVGNFFVAGNLWSSFLAVDQALAVLGARVLPIGGLTDRDAALSYLRDFNAEYLVGLPTQILELARYAETRSPPKIRHVMYAGEHLSLVARNYIQHVFATESFGSAGYASVDAGPIGYQCQFCDGGEHHVFADDVNLEIIEGEGVVTSLVRRQMPIIRLRTGDLLEWLPSGTCTCGSREPRFVLRGRSNSQFNVWGCRMFYQEFEHALADCGVEGALVQLVLSQDDKAHETILLRIETQNINSQTDEAIRSHIYRCSKDLRATHPLSWLVERLKIEWLRPFDIERVQRTGKIQLIIDRR